MANIKRISEEKCLTINRPFVNVLKKYDLSCWKKRFNIGTLSSLYCPQIKSTVHELSGSNPNEANYIQLPKFGHQGLRLEGRYFYLNYLSDPGKNFSIHVDCKLENDARKISISPLFEDFKISKFGCRIPVVFKTKKNGRMTGKMNKTCAGGQMFIFAGDDTRWTTLCLDLEALNDLAWHKTHSHVKGLKFCGEITISHVFLSDYLFVPQHLLQEVMTPLCYVLPEDMSFPLGKGQEWKECYAFVCFPQNTCTNPDCKHSHHKFENERRVSEVSKQNEADANEDDEWMEKSSSSSSSLSNDDELSSGKSSQSDPVLQLEHALGFGGTNMKYAVMDSYATRVIYPCNALLVLQDVNSGVQKFMIGHTDKISCVSVDRDFQLLASAQSGNTGLVRVWSVETLDCLAVLNPGGLTVSCLSISRSGQRLCCLGRDAFFKNVIVVWDITDVRGEGEFKVICRGHTDVQIVKIMMMMTSTFNDFSEERIISCGHGNIRLWRTRGGHLKSTPVNLFDHHTESFVDIGFEVEAEPSEFTERTLGSVYSRAYACTKSFMVFEINCINISILAVIDLKTPSLNKNPTVPSSMLVTQNYFCIGSTCGRLKLRTRDGSVDLIETTFEGAVEVLRSSNDCVRILVGSGDGNLGLLDLRRRQLEPLQSSLGRKIIRCSLDGRTFSMSTLSADGSIRIWSMFDMTKPRCCLSPSRDVPFVIVFHPTLDALFVGCDSGRVRVFETEGLRHLTTLKLHDSLISDLIFNEEGTLLYSCSTSSGKLALHRIRVTNGDDELDPDGQDVIFGGKQIICSHLRTLSDVLSAEPLGHSLGILSISLDGSALVHISPTQSMISVRDSLTLGEVKRIDMKAITKAYDWRAVSTCQHVTFSLGSNTCLIIQSGDGCIYIYDYLNDEIIRQLESHGTSGIVPVVSTFERSNILALACDKVIKVCLNNSSSYCQLFIGHSEPVVQVLFDPTRSALVTVGDAVLTWKFTPGGELPGDVCKNGAEDHLTRPIPGFSHRSLDWTTQYDTPIDKTSISIRRFELSSSEEDDDDVNLPSLPTMSRKVTNHASTDRCFKNRAGLTAEDFSDGFIDLSSIKRRYARIKI